jgi:hypothetical protein
LGSTGAPIIASFSYVVFHFMWLYDSVRHGPKLSETFVSVFSFGFSILGFRFGEFPFSLDGQIVDGVSPGRAGLQ